jgi:hypothetical protein
LLKRQQRAFSKLGHVRERRPINFVGKIAKLVGRLQCLGKNGVGASSNILARPLKRAIETFDRARISPRDDHEIGITARRDGRFDSAYHLFSLHNRFPCKMSTPLWKFLIFNMTTGKTGSFELANSSRRVLSSTKSGICIDNGRNVDGIGDVTG